LKRPDLDPEIAAYVDWLVDQRVKDRVDDFLAGKRFKKQLNLRERVTRSRMRESLYVGPRERVKIDRSAVVKSVMFNTSSGRVVVEKDAILNHFACFLTGTHDVSALGPERREAVPIKGRDILIREGAWVATAAIIIGPCVIGEHAVVAAGSVVTRDVPPYTLVAGNPAKTVRAVGPNGVASGRTNGRRHPSRVGRRLRALRRPLRLP
jgi:acetyltransferase-like isoleucine patch superfamily enzyme